MTLERWNDQALDGLASDVERVEATLLRAEKLEVRRIEAVRRDLRDLRETVGDRFDRLENGTRAAARAGAKQGASRVNWASIGATMLGVATGVGAPIAVAIILSR